MDLSTIKKNLETGIIRTTPEFQRDMMLMFSNAIMYNSSDHNVYQMATEMYDDVMTHIEVTKINHSSFSSSTLRWLPTFDSTHPFCLFFFNLAAVIKWIYLTDLLSMVR